MEKIEVSLAALDTLTRMVEELQAERDEAIKMLRICQAWMQGDQPHRAKAIGEVIANCNG